jgi:TraX protein.
MSRFQLKLLAVVTMLVDHIGAVLFPGDPVLRMIGRLSFPIFAYLISEGLVHTSNVKKYFGRLFLFALISEIPFDLAFRSSLFYPQRQNIFFTLVLGLAALYFLQTYLHRRPAAAILLAACMALLAELTNTDYGWFGVAAIVVFYCFRNTRTRGVFVFALLVAGYSLTSSTLEIFAVGSCIPILLYNGQKGRWNWKYFFYAFYPAHLLILYLIHMIAI